MTTTPEDAYARRIQRVVDYICAHLDEPLDLDRLSEVAGFSKFHLHRQFSAYTGFTVAELIRRTRLKRAAYRLAFSPATRVLDVALEAGFAAPESFARAFKDQHGVSPTEFRASPRWEAITALPSSESRHAMPPHIVQFEATRVAVLEHHGPAGALMSTVGRFIAWRRASGASPIATSRTFGIAYSDPEVVPAGSFRFDVCGELHGALAPNDAGVIEKTIPAGRCAVVRHEGSTDAIARTVRPLYVDWLPQSGERLRDFPLFFHYVVRMPAVAEHEQITDVYLPLEG